MLPTVHGSGPLLLQCVVLRLCFKEVGCLDCSVSYSLQAVKEACRYNVLIVYQMQCFFEVVTYTAFYFDWVTVLKIQCFVFNLALIVYKCQWIW